MEADRLSHSLVADIAAFRQNFPGVITDMMELSILEYMDSMQAPDTFLQSDDLLHIHIRCDMRDGFCSLRVDKSWYSG